MKTTTTKTTSKGKTTKAQTAAAKAQTAADSNVNTNTTMLSLLLPTLPILSEVNKSLRKSFNEIVQGPFRLFDLFSAEYTAMKNKVSANREEERAPTFGLTEFQSDLYAKLALSANKIDLQKLETVIAQRQVNLVLEANDTYQAARLEKYNKDVSEGRKRQADGTNRPFSVFKVWNGNHFQAMIFLAVTRTEKKS